MRQGQDLLGWPQGEKAFQKIALLDFLDELLVVAGVCHD
jgi:hypothetical protein